METERKSRTRTVTWSDPFAILEGAVGKTGLEILQDVFSGKVPPPPIAVLMGFTAVAVEKGKATFEGDPAEYLYNPIGVVHGAFAMALLDSAMGCAVQSTLGVGDRYTTLELKTNFVRPMTIDTGRVRCEGSILHRGRTVATAEGKVIALETGKLLAHGTTTCLIIPARSE